jgi:hypothetical protein
MQSLINIVLALSTAVGVSTVAVPKMNEHMHKKQEKLEQRIEADHGQALGVHKQLAKLKLEQTSASQPAVKTEKAKLDRVEHKSEIKAKVELKKSAHLKLDGKIQKKDAAEQAEHKDREHNEREDKSEKLEKLEKGSEHRADKIDHAKE